MPPATDHQANRNRKRQRNQRARSKQSPQPNHPRQKRGCLATPPRRILAIGSRSVRRASCGGTLACSRALRTVGGIGALRLLALGGPGAVMQHPQRGRRHQTDHQHRGENDPKRPSGEIGSRFSSNAHDAPASNAQRGSARFPAASPLSPSIKADPHRCIQQRKPARRPQKRTPDSTGKNAPEFALDCSPFMGFLQQFRILACVLHFFMLSVFAYSAVRFQACV